MNEQTQYLQYYNQIYCGRCGRFITDIDYDDNVTPFVCPACQIKLDRRCESELQTIWVKKLESLQGPMLFDNDILPKHFKNAYTEYMHAVDNCKMHLKTDSATGRMIYDLNLEAIFYYYTGDLHFAPASAYDNYKMLADLSAGNKILVTTYQEIAKEYNLLKAASNAERWEFGESYYKYDKVIICTDFIITDEHVSPFGELSCHELIIESVHIDKRVTKLVDWFAYCKVDTQLSRCT